MKLNNLNTENKKPLIGIEEPPLSFISVLCFDRASLFWRCPMTENIFGEEQPFTNLPNTEHQSTYMRFKKQNRYRRTDSKVICCKTCVNHIHKEFHGKHYHKCKLIGDSGCTATDIQVSAVCDKFKMET
jgi:hypothetical protein